jgi:hypothetical protein
MQVNARRDSRMIISQRMAPRSSPADQLPNVNRETASRLTVRRVNVWLLGDRDYPERVVKLPHDRVRDLPDLIASAQRFNPAVTPDDVARAIWRLGSRRLHQNLLRRIPVRLSDLP